MAVLLLKPVICLNDHKSLFDYRMVCAALISSDSLEWERTQLWALTFKLIRKIIGGVDYKVTQHTSTAQSKYVMYIIGSFLLKIIIIIMGPVFLFQGVRDLLKAVLDKIQTIPTTVSSSIVQQLLAAREVCAMCSPV